MQGLDRDRVYGEEYSFSVQQVISDLSSHVTPNRFKKIEQVIDQRRSDLCIVMENVYNRGNANAVMRTMEAFGYFQMHTIDLQDEYKNSNRVSQGADKWILDHHWRSSGKCVQHLKNEGFQVLVTSLEGGEPLYDVDCTQPTALCFGNERDGATEELLNLADKKVYVPMLGFVQSFNISVAAALCLQYIRRAQDQVSEANLSPEWRQFLKALYLFRGCQNSERILNGVSSAHPLVTNGPQ